MLWNTHTHTHAHTHWWTLGRLTWWESMKVWHFRVKFVKTLWDKWLPEIGNMQVNWWQYLSVHKCGCKITTWKWYWCHDFLHLAGRLSFLKMWEFWSYVHRMHYMQYYHRLKLMTSLCRWSPQHTTVEDMWQMALGSIDLGAFLFPPHLRLRDVVPIQVHNGIYYCHVVEFLGTCLLWYVSWPPHCLIFDELVRWSYKMYR